NRSNFNITLSSIDLKPNNTKLNPNQHLTENTSWKEKASFKLNENIELTTPSWLTEKGSIGLYNVTKQEWIGLPEAPKPVMVTFNLKLGNVFIPFDREVVYKYNDPVKGEVYQPFEIVPPVTARFPEKVVIFNNTAPTTVPVTITAGKNNVKGTVKLNASKNWKIEPVSSIFEIAKKGESVTLQFRVIPPLEQDETTLTPLIQFNGREYSGEIINIDYDHIPRQTLVVPAETKLVKLDIQKKGEKI